MVVWLWYSFIITASYGGELRAFLLKPKLKSPIDTYRDIVGSGHSWTAVDYNDGLWDYMAYINVIDGVQEFVQDIHYVEYKDFPFEYVSKTLTSNFYYH